MNMKLTYNYWLMILAWCLFISGYNLLSLIMIIVASLILLSTRKAINLWRWGCKCFMCYFLLLLMLNKSNISYYFPSFNIFILLVLGNCFLTKEYLYLFKSKLLYPYLLFMIFGMAVLSIIVVILPDVLYTLFTKKSLYIMISLIFLPYIIPILSCLYRRRTTTNVELKSKGVI